MRSAVLALLVALGARGAGASGDDPLDFRVDMTGEVTFNEHGTSDISLTMMTVTMGIVCYSDWLNPEDGKCNAMDFSSAAPVKGDPLELTSDIAIVHERKSLRFTLARFSDAMAVVCYTRFGLEPGRAVCKILTLSGSGESATLSAGSAFDYAGNATKYVHSMSLVSLSETTGVLCYQDTGTVYQFTRHLACQVLNVQGNDLSSPAVNTTYVNDLEYLDNIVNVSMVSVTDSVSVVCYGDGTKKEAWCNQLSVSESGEELHVGPAFRLGEKLPGEFVPEGSGARVSITALSESKALGCFCSTEAGPTCVPLNLANGTRDSSAITKAGDPLEVGTEMCSEVTVTGMSETGAIVCYLAGDSQVGTCSGLVLNHGKDLSAGDPAEIPDAAGVQGPGAFTSASPCQQNPCDDWIAVAKRDGANAVVCYAGTGGSESGRCQALSIPPPTSTTTPTTISETSTTSGHSTTETSTSTATKTSTLSTTTTASTTTATTTSETSSTTPHTTSQTSQTATDITTTVPETSSAGAPQVAACLAATLTSWMLF